MSDDNDTSLKMWAIIAFVIFTISLIVWISEDTKREEECVEERKLDYGAAPSHETYISCTTPEPTPLQTWSRNIALISFLFSVVFFGSLWANYDARQQLKERERELENTERIRLGIENQAKKFEEENDYLSAITAWRELNMEDEAIRVMKNQAGELEKHKNYSSAITIWRELNMEDEAIRVMKNQADELEKHKNYSSTITIWRELNMEDEAIRVMKNQAYEREKARDYEPAIHIWENLGEIEEAARVRKLQAELGSVKLSQKVVHGDEVSKTEIKDSVVSKSNIGSGGDDKLTKIKELKELHDAGAIDDDEFKQMKKEILGK